MNVNLIHGGTADVIQLVHTLMARQRHLRHVDRLIADAISEALTWVPVDLNSEAMNAGTYVNQIWGTITREARHGSNQTSTTPSQTAAAQSVLLQPGFPSTWDEIQYMLPNVSASVASGYRRRAWRRAVVQATGVHDGSWEDTRGDESAAASLYIIQRDDGGRIPNWPEGVERPPHPVRDLPGRHRGPGRRRHRVPRPRPRWVDSGEAPSIGVAQSTGGVDVNTNTRRRVPSQHWHHGVPRELGGREVVRRRGSSGSRDVPHPRREHLPRQDRSRSRDPE